MISKLKIIEYRKLKNILINFSKNINVISGTNGTCKSSLLYLISNSFQKPTGKLLKTEKNVISIINNINKKMNPKIENLSKETKKSVIESNTVKGTIYTSFYELDDNGIDFRKHASEKYNRFSLKPKYRKGDKTSIPSLPIIYLGLYRLYVFGEYEDKNEEDISNLSKNLPQEYLQELFDIYKDFTHINIQNFVHEEIKYIKKRGNFLTDKDGVDSNTISSGEDNLLIILTALISLKYYYKSIENKDKIVESMLLIDELDATLHPAFQLKLLKLFKDFSEKYKIQIFFTTHSFSLLEKAIEDKEKQIKIIYLKDNIENIELAENLTINKLKNFLKNSLEEKIPNNFIPIFSEDREARLFIEKILDYLENNKIIKNKSVYYLININMGAEQICNLFKDKIMNVEKLGSVAILDGDKFSDKEINSRIICLPGKKSIEELFFKYSKDLFENDIKNFWQDSFLEDNGYTRVWYRDNILVSIEQIDETAKKSNKDKRKINKKIFNNENYFPFFNKVIDFWIKDEKNEKVLKLFIKDFITVTKQLLQFYGILYNKLIIEKEEQ